MSLFDNPPLRNFPARALRQLLENPGNLREQVEVMDPQLCAHLDFTGLEMVPRSYFLPAWRERECDLFFKIPYRTPGMTQAVLVCLLVEHQSVPDPVMP